MTAKNIMLIDAADIILNLKLMFSFLTRYGTVRKLRVHASIPGKSKIEDLSTYKLIVKAITSLIPNDFSIDFFTMTTTLFKLFINLNKNIFKSIRSIF